MKIIHQGLDPANVPITASCMMCGTTVEFQKSEALTEYDRGTPFYTVQCPVCPSKIIGHQKIGGRYE